MPTSLSNLNVITIQGISTVEGGCSVEKKSVHEMEKDLSLDNIKPVEFSENTKKGIDESKDIFDSWYEEELRDLYES